MSTKHITTEMFQVPHSRALYNWQHLIHWPYISCSVVMSKWGNGLNTAPRLFHSCSSGNCTPGSRFYSDFLDTLGAQIIHTIIPWGPGVNLTSMVIHGMFALSMIHREHQLHNETSKYQLWGHFTLRVPQNSYKLSCMHVTQLHESHRANKGT